MDEVATHPVGSDDFARQVSQLRPIATIATGERFMPCLEASGVQQRFSYRTTPGPAKG